MCDGQTNKSLSVRFVYEGRDWLYRFTPERLASLHRRNDPVLREEMDKKG